MRAIDRSSGAFTLLETLIALTISAVTMGLIASASLNAWKKARGRLDTIVTAYNQSHAEILGEDQPLIKLPKGGIPMSMEEALKQVLASNDQQQGDTSEKPQEKKRVKLPSLKTKVASFLAPVLFSEPEKKPRTKLKKKPEPQPRQDQEPRIYGTVRIEDPVSGEVTAYEHWSDRKPGNEVPTYVTSQGNDDF